MIVFIERHLSKNTWAANTNLTIPQICKSVQRFWRYVVIKNITYIQNTREKHNPSLAIGNKIISSNEATHIKRIELRFV